MSEDMNEEQTFPIKIYLSGKFTEEKRKEVKQYLAGHSGEILMLFKALVSYLCTKNYRIIAEIQEEKEPTGETDGLLIVWRGRYKFTDPFIKVVITELEAHYKVQQTTGELKVQSGVMSSSILLTDLKERSMREVCEFGLKLTLLPPETSEEVSKN